VATQIAPSELERLPGEELQALFDMMQARQ